MYLDIVAVAHFSAVHRCFGILEVLQNIVQHIHAYEEVGSRTLVALSTTCRMFYDVAQDVLWRHQTGLVPLLTCLPEAVWDQDVMSDSNLFVSAP